MEMAVIMKRGMARLDESEGATAVRTGSSVLWRAEIQKHLGQDAKYPEAGQNKNGRVAEDTIFCTVRAHAANDTSHQGG